jgi:DNA mismatch repair protein MutL
MYDIQVHPHCCNYFSQKRSGACPFSTVYTHIFLSSLYAKPKMTRKPAFNAQTKITAITQITVQTIVFNSFLTPPSLQVAAHHSQITSPKSCVSRLKSVHLCKFAPHMDIIRLLPDNIANQIAAGEVIQRPASAVKELLENSVDSGATHIKLIVKTAGKSLVQVIDNGCGMSETDARMCFEKHATSKIRTAEDLFNIRTMGFRGEALASIAAIAQVEMKTRPSGEALGTCLEIEGMKVNKQEPCQTPEGTSIAVKNLFFNVPARRNFLKSDTVELKNIIDEFQRIALAHPKIGLQLFNNDYEMYHLKPGNLKQRIAGLFGDNYTERLVPVEEKSYALHVYGFVGKPEFCKKTRGEQYIFVNNRYIKSAYLNHAVSQGFDQMIPKDSYPFFVLFLDIDPTKIDINVHPAKHEIKFEDEKLAYTFVNLGVKHALGAYSVSPTLDFNQEDHLNHNKANPH